MTFRDDDLIRDDGDGTSGICDATGTSGICDATTVVRDDVLDL